MKPDANSQTCDWVNQKKEVMHPMQVTPIHPWNVSPREAIRIQKDLANRVIPTCGFSSIHTIAGADVGIKGGQAKAAVVVLSYPDLRLLDQSIFAQPVSLPYIPGLLSFRECPPLLAAFERLSLEPDLILVDGQGIAHPRRLGLASHLGLFLEKPTIGCAKSRLCGTCEEPGETAGSHTCLYDGEELIGAALRTKNRTRVLYVSIGHKVDLNAAIHYVLTCCRGYRLPETTRWAHRIAGS